MLSDFTITCKKCGAATVGYDNCKEEYHFEIDGWDGGIDFYGHRKEYCEEKIKESQSE